MSGQTTVSKQAPSPSLTSSSAEPEQQTELVCPECGSTHVRRSQRTGPSERFRGLFGFYPYRCRGCSSRFFLKTSSNLLRRPHTTGPIKRFREILGLFTYRWHEYLSRFFRPPGSGRQSAEEPGTARDGRCSFGPAELLASWRSLLLDPGHRPETRSALRLPFRFSTPLILMSSRLLYVLWLVSILLVVIGSLLPASSPVIRAVGRLPVSQKVLHFCAYTWMALLALLTIKRRPLAVMAALSMILLGVALEFGQKAGTRPGIRNPGHVHQRIWGAYRHRHRHPEPPYPACGQQQLTPLPHRPRQPIPPPLLQACIV